MFLDTFVPIEQTTHLEERRQNLYYDVHRYEFSYKTGEYSFIAIQDQCDNKMSQFVLGFNTTNYTDMFFSVKFSSKEQLTVDYTAFERTLKHFPRFLVIICKPY